MVSVIINVKGYHIPSVDIWAYDKVHNMDPTHFLSWLDSTCATLREDISELTHYELNFLLALSGRRRHA